jgi:hypothetical protein
MIKVSVITILILLFLLLVRSFETNKIAINF